MNKLDCLKTGLINIFIGVFVLLVTEPKPIQGNLIYLIYILRLFPLLMGSVFIIYFFKLSFSKLK